VSADRSQEDVLHPLFDERLAGRALGLRILVLVMRELQVHAAAVDVELLAKQRAAHRRALDMPAGPALAPRRGPLRLVGLGALPQDEVQWIFLVRIHLHALTAATLILTLARNL